MISDSHSNDGISNHQLMIYHQSIVASGWAVQKDYPRCLLYIPISRQINHHDKVLLLPFADGGTENRENQLKPGMVVHACSPGTQEVKTGRLEFKASPSYIVTSPAWVSRDSVSGEGRDCTSPVKRQNQNSSSFPTMQRCNHVHSLIHDFQLNQAARSHLLKELWLSVSWFWMLFFLSCVYSKVKDLFLCLVIVHLSESVMKSEAMITDRSCPSQSHCSCCLHVLEGSGSISEFLACVACHPGTWDGYHTHNQ